MRPQSYKNSDSLEYWPKEMTLMAYEGEIFFVEMPKKKYYSVMGGYYFGRGNSAELMQMPASYSIDAQKTDKAIYIGTIKYTRDVFYKWKKAEVLEEYKDIFPEFVKLYGKKVKLRKALAKAYGLK